MRWQRGSKDILGDQVNKEVNGLDWGRAKNVLIYAFLLLNLVLGYQIWMDARETAGANLDFTSLADNTQQAMEEKGIQVLAPIPNETPKLPKLSYEFTEEDKSGIEVELEEPVDSKLIFSPSELADALQAEIPQIGTYRLDQLMAEDGAFVLHPLVDGKWPLFNVSLELFYSDQKITGYHQTPVRITTAEESDQQVLPASKALGTLIENFLPNNAIVKDIQLGYYGQLFNSDIQVAMPAWRFVLESGEVLYVQGISGDVFSPKSDKPGE